jgi:hypothetical protein
LPNWYNDTGKDQHSIVAHPQFVDPENHDFRLRSTSPAINAGKTQSVPTDFDGNARPYGTAFDMGAFEWQPPPAALYGDYNRSGVVDSADYVVWRKTLNQTVPSYSGADGNGDRAINQPDYAVWREHFGQTVPASPAAGSGQLASEPPQPILATVEQISQASLALDAEPTLEDSNHRASEELVKLANFVPLRTSPTAYRPPVRSTVHAATALSTIRKGDVIPSLMGFQSHAPNWSYDHIRRSDCEKEEERQADNDIVDSLDTVFAMLGNSEVG